MRLFGLKFGSYNYSHSGQNLAQITTVVLGQILTQIKTFIVGENFAELTIVFLDKTWVRLLQLFGPKFGSDNNGYCGPNIAQTTMGIVSQKWS